MLAKINKTNAQTIVSLICNQVSMSPAILLRLFGCIAPKTLNYLVFQFWILSVHDEGYSRNALCTLSLISTFWLPGNYMNDIYLDYHLWVCYIALGGGMLEYLYICSSTALNVSVGILWISNIIQKKPEKDCHMPCKGNTRQICGGGWRNSIYYQKGNSKIQFVISKR
jgi:hypothetical protein